MTDFCILKILRKGSFREFMFVVVVIKRIVGSLLWFIGWLRWSITSLDSKPMSTHHIVPFLSIITTNSRPFCITTVPIVLKYPHRIHLLRVMALVAIPQSLTQYRPDSVTRLAAVVISVDYMMFDMSMLEIISSLHCLHNEITTVLSDFMLQTLIEMTCFNWEDTCIRACVDLHLFDVYLYVHGTRGRRLSQHNGGHTK